MPGSNTPSLPPLLSSIASRPWMIYWITHALKLLGNDASHYHERIIDTLSHFQNPTGGFGGGPAQLSHGFLHSLFAINLLEPQILPLYSRSVRLEHRKVWI